mmetsp:Transcript_21916/g.16259  ORF Transcript_21916/g.16259 Transcript_21916/m.16259 type:complete len:81 (+) Transcript_21916:1-243(+)
MGILPLQFKKGESADTHGLNGTEKFTLHFDPQHVKIGQEVEVEASTGKKFTVDLRLDTDPEITYYQNGGILIYVLRKLLN